MAMPGGPGKGEESTIIFNERQSFACLSAPPPTHDVILTEYPLHGCMAPSSPLVYNFGRLGLPTGESSCRLGTVVRPYEGIMGSAVHMCWPVMYVLRDRCILVLLTIKLPASIEDESKAEECTVVACSTTSDRYGFLLRPLPLTRLQHTSYGVDGSREKTG
jgi:hypothetical protein